MVKVQFEVFDDRSTGVDSVEVLWRSGYPGSVDQKSVRILHQANPAGLLPHRAACLRVNIDLQGTQLSRMVLVRVRDPGSAACITFRA